MRDRQRLQKPRVSVRCVARGAGLEPLVQVGRPIDNPAAQLAIRWSISVESELGKGAFGEPNVAGGHFCTDDLR